jgi:hypothetical protein
MQMEEEYITSNEVSKTKTIFKSKQFFITTILLAGFLAVNEIINIIRTYYDARASLSYFFGFIHIFYEWYRAFIFLLIVLSLLSFLFRVRKGISNYTKGLKRIKSMLMFNLVIDLVLSIILFGVIDKILLYICAVGIILSYNIFLIKYIRGLIDFMDNTQEKLPSPFVPIIYLTGLIVFLIFHYFYTQFGGNYAVLAYKPSYYINAPFTRIISLLLVQVAMIFIISTIHQQDNLGKFYRVLSLFIAGITFIAILSIGIIESSVSHYQVSAFDNGTNERIEITVMNGKSKITPTGFYDIKNDVDIDLRRLDSYLIQYDYDLMSHIQEISSIDSRFIMTLNIADNSLITRIKVYNENGFFVQGFYEWYKLDKLSPGTYYIIVDLSILGDPCFHYADYLFILTVS